MQNIIYILIEQAMHPESAESGFFRSIACWGAELNAALSLNTRARIKIKDKNWYNFFFLFWAPAPELASTYNVYAYYESEEFVWLTR